MCKMNLANKVLLYLLFSANVNHATHCAEINGAMVRIKFSSNASLGLFNKKKNTHTFNLLFRCIIEHWFYFILKQLKNQDNPVNSFHLGLFLSLPEV